jgi:hypothetical protein
MTPANRILQLCSLLLFLALCALTDGIPAHAAAKKTVEGGDYYEQDYIGEMNKRTAVYEDTLVKVARAIGNRGGKVVLIGPNEAARKVLASTGVDTIVTIVDDYAAAQAAFA